MLRIARTVKTLKTAPKNRGSDGLLKGRNPGFLPLLPFLTPCSNFAGEKMYRQAGCCDEQDCSETPYPFGLGSTQRMLGFVRQGGG
jgi:hypothetical protein